MYTKEMLESIKKVEANRAANAALELSLTGKQDPKAALDSAEKQVQMQIEAMQASNQ